MRKLLGFLVVLGAACGDDGVGKLPDAPGGPDSPNAIDAATSGVVTLTITSDATPVPNVKVYFQNADSSLVSATMTDATGVATATMEPGGFVTAIDPFLNVALPTGIGITHDLRTFAGVKPGDHLVLHDTQAGIPATNVNLAIPLDPNAVSYLLNGSCDGQSQGCNLTAGVGSGSGAGGPCQLFCTGTTADLVIESFDANNNSVSSITKLNVALAEGATIDLTAETYVASTDVTWNYTNVPAGVGSLGVSGVLATARGPIVFSPTQIQVVANNMANTLPIKRPVVAGALQINDSRFFGGSFSEQAVIEWGAPIANYALDMASVLLPNFISEPAYDFTAHSLGWTDSAAGAAPDFTKTQMFFQHATGSMALWTWDLVEPYGGVSAVFPVLPAPDADFNAITGDTFVVNELTTAKVPGGYDAVRAQALTFAGFRRGPIQAQGFDNIAIGNSGRAAFQPLNVGGKRVGPPSQRWSHGGSSQTRR